MYNLASQIYREPLFSKIPIPIATPLKISVSLYKIFSLSEEYKPFSPVLMNNIIKTLFLTRKYSKLRHLIQQTCICKLLNSLLDNRGGSGVPQMANMVYMRPSYQGNFIPIVQRPMGMGMFPSFQIQDPSNFCIPPGSTSLMGGGFSPLV